jgi:hypothetical protein
LTCLSQLRRGKRRGMGLWLDLEYKTQLLQPVDRKHRVLKYRYRAELP